MAKTEVTGSQIKDGSVSLTADVTGILPVANGGSGSNTLALNNVLLGNGTGALQAVAPGTAGNVLTSNGTSWSSSPVSVSIANITGTTAQFNTALTDNDFATLAGTETLTNKTIQLPRPDSIYSTDGSLVNSYYIGNSDAGRYPYYSPVSKYLWHDILRFSRFTGVPTYETYNGTAWSSQTLDTNILSGKEATAYALTNGTTTTGARWTWTSGNLSYSYLRWWVIGLGYVGATVPINSFLVESSADGTTWTTRHTSTVTSQAAPIWLYASDHGGHNRLRLTIITTNAQAINLSGIKGLSSRWANQGGGVEYEFPYDWDGSRNITTLANLTVGTPGTSAGSVATIDATQTLTNKSLTSPTITGTPVANFAVTRQVVGKGKFLPGTVIDPSPIGQGDGSISIGLHNDLAYLIERGGTGTITQNGTSIDASGLSALFKGSGLNISAAAVTDVFVIEVTKPPTHPYGAFWQVYQTGINFRAGFVARSVKIEHRVDGVWTTSYDVTGDTEGVHYVKAGAAPPYVDAFRFTLTDFQGAGANLCRIQNIWSIGTTANPAFSSAATNFLPRSGGDLFGSAALAPSLQAAGGDANIPLNLYSKGTGAVVLRGTNGISLLANTAAASSVNYVQATGNVAGSRPYLQAGGSDTNIDLDLFGKGTGIVRAGGVPVVTTTSTATLTNKTLTSPVVDQLAVSTGGTGLAVTGVASAANALGVSNSIAGSAPYVYALGADANVNLNLIPKGTGVVQANGIPVVTTTGAQTVTNKTISGASNTVTNLPASATPLASRLVATTSVSVANNWYKVATFAPGSNPYYAHVLKLHFVALVYGSSSVATVNIHMGNEAAAANPRVQVRMTERTGTFADDFLKVVSGAYGTDIEVWIRFTSSGNPINVYEMARYDNLGALTYHTFGTWQATEPVGAVNNVKSAGLELTSPRVNQVNDTNGAAALVVGATASAVNYAQITNAAAGGNVLVNAAGTDTNIPLAMRPKGTSPFVIQTGNTNNMLVLYPGAGGASTNYFNITGAATGATPSFGAVGSDTNVSLNLTSQGTGTVNANGVPVVTTTGTQTLTSKTLTSPAITTPTGITKADVGLGNVDNTSTTTISQSLRANRNLNGGGTFTVDASSNVKWSNRMMVISNGRGTNFATDGYFTIDCPVTGTVTGVGGAANKTATAAGIPLTAYEALYYILPIGSGNASVAANFRVALYTGNLNIPHDWVLICVRSDSNVFTFNNGITLRPGESLNCITQDTAATVNTLVRRDASGNFSAGTITATLSGNATSATSATSANTATTATYVTTGTADNASSTVNFRVMRNSNTTTLNDGMFIGYGNSNGGLTRLYGGGETANPVSIGAGGTVAATGAITSGGVTVPTISSTHTLTNKTIALGSNTVSGTLAQFNTAVTDADLARTDAANTFTGVQTMTSPALTTPVITGIPTGTGVATAGTANTLALRDASGNLAAENFVNVVDSTATAAGTTTLTLASGGTQVFTGTTTQTVRMPTTGVVAGQKWTIINQSTGAVAIQSSTGAAMFSLPAAYAADVTCLFNTPTTALHWRGSLWAQTAGLIPTTSNSLAAFTQSTTNAIGVGTIELGHASDTTLSRSAAGTLAVEGVVVPTISSAVTLTNKTIALGSNTVSGTLAQFNTAVTDADLVSLAGTETLTNKRVTPRVVSVASSATPAINTDNGDVFNLTSLATNVTSMTTSLTGTPIDGQRMTIRVKSAAAQTITWGASFVSSGAAMLPTTTVAGATHRLDFLWDAADSDWVCVGSFHKTYSSPPTRMGSGITVNRTATGLASLSTGENIFPLGWFGNVVRSTDDLTYDTSGTNTGKVTVSVEGWYQCTISCASGLASAGGGVLYSILWTGSGAGARSVAFYGGQSRYNAAGGTGPSLNGSFIIYLQAGDYVEPGYYSNVAVSNTLGNTSSDFTSKTTWFSVALINRSHN